MRTWTADSRGEAGAAWELLARPARWHEWAPHLRGAWGLGGEVAAGDAGAVRLLGVVPVPVRIIAVEPGRSWTWRASALADMEHRVEPRPGGCRIAIDLRAPAPLKPRSR